MDFLKRISVVSKLFQYKTICLMFSLLIVMMKIMSFTCQDLTGSITSNGISETVFSIPVNDFWPCNGKTNCYYQRTSTNCTKMTQLSIGLNLTTIRGLKPPPLIATLSTVTRKNRRGLFKDPFNVMDQSKPLELILCDKRMDMLQWAKTSVKANTSSPPALYMDVSIVYPKFKKSQNIKMAALEFSSVFVIVFNDPPECVLVDDYNHKVFWSDNIRGTIETFDTKTNQIEILANLLEMPGSMAIDSTLKFLFWCNINTIGKGSIERINFDGSNRVEITKRKYDLAYPETLGIDPENRMLYWTDNQVIHTSDYNGNNHKTLEKSDIYDQNFPGCFSFSTDVVEHNFFWENRQLQHFNRRFVPNHLVSILYHKDSDALSTMDLPAAFRQHHNLEHVKRRTLNVSCPKSIGKNNNCFLLPVPLSTSSYIWDNQTLKMNGYRLLEEYNISKRFGHKDLNMGTKWYVNSNTQTVLYYDPEIKHIRPLFYVIQDTNNTFIYKYKANYIDFYMFEYINVYTSDIIVFDSIEKSFFLLNTTNNSTERFDFEGVNGRRYLSPNIFSYVTQVMDYNNASSHRIAIKKYVLKTVLKLALSFM